MTRLLESILTITTIFLTIFLAITCALTGDLRFLRSLILLWIGIYVGVRTVHTIRVRR